MNTGSDGTADPMAAALCASGLPARWWVDPPNPAAGRAAADLCLTSCEVLDECRRWARWHRPHDVAQAGEWWPSLADFRLANVPSWWPDDPGRPPWLK